MAILTNRIEKTKTREVVKAPNEKPALLQADILVVGMGSAGVTAAIQAARLGKKVVLADSLAIPGGQAINSNVGLLCGFYSKSTPHYLYTYGVVEDLLRDLDKENALYYRDSGITVSVAYDEQAFLRWIDSNIVKEGIIPLNGVSIDSVEKAGRRLTAVNFTGRFGKVRVEATSFIDASGDAALTWNAGLPCRESDEGQVYGTQIVVVDNVDLDKFPGEKAARAAIAEKAAAFGVERHDGIAFLFPQKNRLILNMTHMETPLDQVAFSRSAITGRERAERAFRFMCAEYPEAFANATVHSYGHPGIRQTRWIKGTKQL
ncbi:MAG: FAD-dependent oxidoreductase, partial [Deferribacteraceae bacterium]|nr:FAD-dependent oxidoreductase [Deferribacteraceae bacterium]